MRFDQLRIKLEEASVDVAELSDEELDKMVDDLEWDDIKDLYPEDEDELEDHLEDQQESYTEDDNKEEVKEDFLFEKLSASARMRKRMSFMRNKPKTTMARNVKLRRAATSQVLLKRAKVAARRALYKKFLRGRNKATMSASEKDRIEAQIARMKNIQINIANKMLPKIRSLESKRLASIRGGKKKK